MNKFVVIFSAVLVSLCALWGNNMINPKNADGPLYKIGEDFWRVRADYHLAGLINIGTQMGVVRLPSGKFLILDAVPMSEGLKAELDTLTSNGTLVEAVLATHPFHTWYLEKLWGMYPNAQFYGTPRHVHTCSRIPWAGDLGSCAVRAKWAPHIEMRIPAGAEFVDPQPAMTNHFSSVFVLHRRSSTLYVDDTIMYFDNPQFPINLFVNEDHMRFHISMDRDGLYPLPKAPLLFRDWLLKLLRDWDFDNLSAAHDGVLVGGAKQRVARLVEEHQSRFTSLSDKRLKEQDGSARADPNRMTIEEC